MEILKRRRLRRSRNISSKSAQDLMNFLMKLSLRCRIRSGKDIIKLMRHWKQYLEERDHLSDALDVPDSVCQRISLDLTAGSWLSEYEGPIIASLGLAIYFFKRTTDDDLHTKQTGHTEFQDKTAEMVKEISLEFPKAAAMDVDEESPAGASSGTQPQDKQVEGGARLADDDDLHTKQTGHTEFQDKTAEMVKEISLEFPKAAAMDVDEESPAGASSGTQPQGACISVVGGGAWDSADRQTSRGRSKIG
ncbi:hypothetical protein Tsubulata_004937 [Turnera subulata]|uniref:Uncharacterized protein n=1 Tax=Turnera subulata TaxID=218843 RepID=A0A9Q0J4H6_9ROSI|nr:hypothetical protein Tsubulata_004937 [Turnera subulata]